MAGKRLRELSKDERLQALGVWVSSPLGPKNGDDKYNTNFILFEDYEYYKD